MLQDKCRVLNALVREVQANRTSSNLLELYPHRESKVYRLLSNEFGVVRLERTFSNYMSSGVQGAIYTSWMRFKHIEPSRTTCSLHTLAEVRCCTSSGWFKHIEPHRTFSKHIITEIAECKVLSHEFRVVRPPHRTFSTHSSEQLARCVEFCLMSSRWIGLLKPHDFRESKVCRVLSHKFGVEY